MNSLSHCLGKYRKEFSITKEEESLIQARSKKIRNDEGHTARESQQMAVQAFLDEAQSNLESVYKQIGRQSPESAPKKTVPEPVPVVEAPKPSDIPPVVPSTATPPVQPKTPEAAAQQLQKPVNTTFEAGTVVMGHPTMDFSRIQNMPAMKPEDWERAVRTNLKSGEQGDRKGNRSLTRIAVALQKPGTNEIILTGVTTPPFINNSTGGRVSNPLTVQRMGAGLEQRTIHDGGNLPILLTDLVRAGYQPIAIIHFQTEPTTIFQRFENVDQFNRAWDQSGRSIPGPTATTTATVTPTLDANLAVSEINGLSRIEAEINRVGEAWIQAEQAGNTAEVARLQQRYEALFVKQERALQQNQNQSGTVPLNPNDQPIDPNEGPIAQRILADRAAQQLPANAAHALTFSNVVTRLRNMGGRVELFGQELFRQGVTQYVQQQLTALHQRLAAATTDAQKAMLNRQISQLNDRAAVLNQAQGVTFTPHHIAVSMSDVQNGDLGNVVTLLHEAAESLTMGLTPTMRGAVMNAVAQSVSELRQQAAESARQTGATVATETGPEDLLAETMAQKMTAAGVQNAPSLVQAILRWVKDLYYRVSMAAQAAFGVTPSAQTALDWYENQLRRIVSGDYDYRLARMLDSHLKVPAQENVKRFSGANGTPGGVADFWNPYTGRVEQPSVLTDSSDAFNWNVQFRQERPTTGNEIPEGEAVARQHFAAVMNAYERMSKIFTESETTMPWDKWWKLVGVGDDPKMIMADAVANNPALATATIGGERMTSYMNGLAAAEARQLMERIEYRAKENLLKLREQIETESGNVISSSREINEVEADRRNSELHERILQDKLKELVNRFLKDYTSGLNTAQQHGALAQAVRQAEQLGEDDPVPEHYQTVFRSLLDGKSTVWGYISAIAKLELPLSDLTGPELRKAIRDNADGDPDLAALVKNRPMLVALSTLALKNQALMDDIALGREANAAKYAEIHTELQTIRQATRAQLDDMISAMEERGKATTLRERIRDDYISRRRDLRTATERVGRATERADAITKAIPGIGDAVEQSQIEGGGAMNEWKPYDGAKYTAMVLGDDGKWTPQQRTLKFNPDGTAVDGNAIRSALFANNQWLKENAHKEGSQHWETVKKQTGELMMLDLQRSNPAVQSWKLTKLLAPLVDNAKRIGGAAALRVAQKMRQFEFIRGSHDQDVQANAHRWSNAYIAVQKSTGIKDVGVLREQIYDPINYFLNVNPGLDEDAAIRQATKQARLRMVNQPDEHFDTAFANLLRETKANSEYLVGVANQRGVFTQDKRLKSEFRKALAQGWLTNMRKFDGGLVRSIVDDMTKAGWTLGFEDVKSRGLMRKQVVGSTTFQDLTSQDTSSQNTGPLTDTIQRLFPPTVIRSWLEPFINKGGKEVFNYDGEAIPPLLVQEAWNQSNGGVIEWIDNLARLLPIEKPTEDNPDPLGQFRYSMLKQIDGLFSMESKLAYESSQTRDLFDPMGPKPHVMMDARLNDSIPAEHLDFATYDPHTAKTLLAEIAFHGAFGRNGESMVQDLNEMADAQAVMRARYQSLKGTTDKARQIESQAHGWNYDQIKGALHRAGDIDNLKNGIEQLMAVGRPGGPFDEVRAGLAFQSFMVGQTVDNPKTGLYNTLSNFDRPFAQRSLGPAAIKNSFLATGESIKGALGSLFEALNLHILHSSEAYKEVTNAMGGARNLPWSQAIADIGPGGNQGKLYHYMVKPLTILRYIQNKGVGSPAEAKEFPRMAPVPGLGVNNYLGQVAGAGGVIASLSQLEKLITNGIRYFSANGDAASDPNFKFKAGDLGFGKFDQGVFDWWRSNAVEYGLGHLEDIVRNAMPAAAKGDRLLTKDQVLRVAQMSMTEFDGQSSINTTPSFMQENPVMRNLLPLLRWPFWKMSQVHKGMHTVEGQSDYAAMARGLATLALWNLPLGLAFTFALDRYDEDLLKKKSNLPSTDKLAGLPLVGPVLDLVMSDKSIPDNLKAYLVRSARAGNTYGMASDLIGQIASPAEAASGRRVFSMDQRILAMSQFLNFQQAMQNFAHQGWTATWASVWAPLFRSLGGNGALHGLDIVNRVLDLDNAESRLVMRVNAQNWLRAAASETDVPLRQGSGSGNPTPMSVWTREMLAAAMANDRIGFMEAHRKALDAARAAVAEDPNVPLARREQEAETRVLSGWRARDPLSIFAAPPTQYQMNAMMHAMDQSGQEDVRDAINRYKQFTGYIKPDLFTVQMNNRIRAMENPRSLQPRMPTVGSLY